MDRVGKVCYLDQREATMFSETPEPDRETVSEPEIPTEPRIKVVAPTRSLTENGRVAVQESFVSHFAPTEEPPHQVSHPPGALPSLQSVGSRDLCGTISTLSSADVLLQRLEEAARIPDRRVSLWVHDEHGWHELFPNRGPTKQPGWRASYVRDIVGNHDLDLWVGSVTRGEDGDDDHEGGKIDGYQLVVYEQV